MAAVQRDATWASTATAEAILAAHDAGELRTLLGQGPTQRDDAWLKSATPEEVAAAYEAGELNDLQGIPMNELGNPLDNKGRVIG